MAGARNSRQDAALLNTIAKCVSMLGANPQGESYFYMSATPADDEAKNMIEAISVLAQNEEFKNTFQESFGFELSAYIVEEETEDYVVAKAENRWFKFQYTVEDQVYTFYEPVEVYPQWSIADTTEEEVDETKSVNFVKGLTTNEISDALRTSLRERFGSEKTYIYVRDFSLSDNWVVYTASNDAIGNDKSYRLPFFIKGKDVVLDDSQPIEVEIKVEYEIISKEEKAIEDVEGQVEDTTADEVTDEIADEVTEDETVSDTNEKTVSDATDETEVEEPEDNKSVDTDEAEDDKKKDNNLKALRVDGENLVVGNHIILWGNEKQRDLEGLFNNRKNKDGSIGEWFTKNTKVDSAYTEVGLLHIDWEHGFDDDKAAPGKDDVLGYVDWKTAKVTDEGLWVERILNRRKKYVQLLEPLILARLIGTSSEPVQTGVKKAATGEILEWPLKRDSLTVSPMEPRMVLGNNVLQSLKALQEENITDELRAQIDAILSEGSGEGETDIVKQRLRLKAKIAMTRAKVQI